MALAMVDKKSDNADKSAWPSAAYSAQARCGTIPIAPADGTFV
jgi:hypothetical protein